MSVNICDCETEGFRVMVCYIKNMLKGQYSCMIKLDRLNCKPQTVNKDDKKLHILAGNLWYNLNSFNSNVIEFTAHILWFL